eukprot:CAMPEP_0114533636 /NCGR_PEP_ID=MMETSP0109-20121206/27362_1 /TAXON_ID=29199 /ORGANISM="Chlorarachnion reptans, Strain CCCM449" /LENGTH=65 /DNA_ID=CAMNT_0001716895 /DNA_START=167 /DNA_END=361 /DNA_ORIENTATION=+
MTRAIEEEGQGMLSQDTDDASTYIYNTFSKLLCPIEEEGHENAEGDNSDPNTNDNGHICLGAKIR